MYRHGYFLVMHCLPLLLAMLGSSCQAQSSQPTGLMIEFIRCPGSTPIQDRTPEFCWIVNGTKAGDFQTAYQILVASAQDELESFSADVWDSGKIQSSQSSNVEYAGKPLQEHSQYFWQVRSWNSDDRPSRFSEIQSFQTGELSEGATTSNSFEVHYLDAREIENTGTNHYFVDFGKAAFGTLILRIKSPVHAVVKIHLGEKLASPTQVDRNPGGSIRYQQVDLEVSPEQEEYAVRLSPDKRNTGPTAVALPKSLGVVMPFRYCEIENCPVELNYSNIKQKVVHYYFEDDAGYFECSDTILNQIWDLCKYSIKATSFCGLYIDGDRERIPYEGDALINQLSHYCTDREYTMARRTNEYFLTHPTWPTEWLLHNVLLFYYDYLYTGNLESIKLNYELLKHKTLIELAREDGLISSRSSNVNDEFMKKLGFSDPTQRIRDIVDWPGSQKEVPWWDLALPQGERDGYEMAPINTVVNSFHYYNLKLMSKLAHRLGKDDESSFYRQRAVQVKTSINEKLLDRTQGIYLDGEGSSHSALHANMMPLAFGIVPDEYHDSVVKFIKSRGMACSVYGSQYLLEGLYEAGEADYALELMTATDDRSWWNMIRSGSTITMEAWDMKHKPNSDWNHAWGAAPANIIVRYLWGIRPIEAGCGRIRIQPQLSRLTWSKIKVPTIKGFVVCDFKQTSEQVKTFHITIPANMTAEFVYDVRDKHVVLDGKPLTGQNGNTVPSGTHKIEIHEP